jgi:formylglycine-generating enzyme required for sulfatase activity
VDYTSVKERTVVATSEDGQALGSCALGMVLIPAGPMLYGPVEEKNVQPGAKDVAQRLNVQAFCIDKFEYPNEPGEAPMRSATWVEARTQCSNRGKRLCTEYEFEKACRGPSGTLYTYGDGYAAGACPNSTDDYGLGQFINCISGFGTQDMGGGVYEWTSSSAGEDTHSEVRILRGGLADGNGEQTSRCTYRSRFAPAQASREVGFRCCGALIKEDLGGR